MEPYTMIKVSAILFGTAAVGGAVMATMRFCGIPRPPAWIAMGHGLMAGAGLTLLIYAAIIYGIPALAQYALGCFIIAAMGGAIMNIFFHWKLLPLPIPLMVIHATLAITGFVLLLICVYKLPHA